MSQGTSVLDFVFLGFLGAVGLGFYLYRDRLSLWSDELESDYKAALRTLNVGGHDLVVDRVIRLGPGKTPEVYRILRDTNEHYFLYIKTENDPGVLKPLSKERALLAAKMSGFER